MLPDRWTEDLPWIGQYVLDENGDAVPAKSLLEWAEWMENHTADRIVLRDKVGDVLISTVFLALDMGMNHLPFNCAGLRYAPVLWETMIFGGVHNGYQVRYTSKDAALEGHIQAVRMVKA